MSDSNKPLENVPCGLCGGIRFTHLFMARDYIYGNEGEWPVARCESCGVVLMHPRISPDDIGNYYPTAYYAHNTVVRDDSILDSIRKAFKDAAIERYFGYTIGHERSLYNRFLGWLLLPLSKYHTYSSKCIYPVPNGICLDIGAGNGQRLSEYKRLGWRTEGVEPSAAAADIARSAGHKIYNNIFEAAYPSRYFDAVTLWDALEHIPNPAEVLHEVHRILKPGGAIYISVPNYGSWYGRVYQDHWIMFTAPVHYFHYTISSLTNLLQSTGFEMSSIRYPLGDVGLQHTLCSVFNSKSIASRFLNSLPIRKMLTALDYFLPYGHINVMATCLDCSKTKEQ